MRTLKKTLALVLCLAMVAGLCCFGTSAAFADAAEIEKTEAAEVMNALGVLKGDGTNFNPKGILTRAEAAVMIAKLLGGGDMKATSTYKDMAGFEWAQSYAAFCENAGIIKGDGKGNFLPGQTLTGYQFGLMLIRALGYQPAKEGVDAASYEIGTAALMKKIELNKAVVGFDGTAGLTREKAAALMLKALGTNMVTYGGGSSIVVTPENTTINFNQEGVAGPTGKTLYEEYFTTTVNYTGIVTANASNNALNGVAGTTTVSAIGGGSKSFKLETGADMIGKYVEVWYDAEYTGVYTPGETYAIVDKTVEIAVAPTMTAKEVQTALATAGYDATETSFTFTSKYQNGAGTSSAKTIAVGTTSGAGLGALTLYGWYNPATKLVVPYGYAVADTYTVDKVTAVSPVAGKEAIVLNSGALQNNATTDEVNEYEGIAAGDYVAVYQYGSIYNLVKLDKVTGKATAKNTSAIAPTLTVNGTVYSVALATNNSGASAVELANVGYATEYDLYLDQAGKVCMITGVAANTDLVYVVDTYTTTAVGAYGAATPKYFIQGLNTAGEEVSYQVYVNAESGRYYISAAAAETNHATNGVIAKDTLYSVETAYDAEQFATMATLAPIANDGTLKGSERYTNQTLAATAVKANNGSYYFASDVKFVFYQNSKDLLKVTVVDGVQAIPAETTYTVYGTKAATASIYDVKYVFVNAAPTAAQTASIAYAYELANSTKTVPYVNELGVTGTAWEHTVYVDGVKTTILTSSATALQGFKTLSTNAVTGITTAAGYSDVTTATKGESKVATKVYNSLLTATAGVTDAKLANAKIVDLTGNGIETVAGLKSLIDCGGAVTVSYIYDTVTNAVSIVYINSASFVATIALDGSDLDAAVTANTFGTSNAKIAVNGLTYKWTKSADDTVYATVADATTATLTAPAAGYYKVTITVTTTTGEVFTATSSAYQVVAS